MSMRLSSVHFLCPNDIRPEHFNASCPKQLLFREFWPEMRSLAKKLKKLKMNIFMALLLVFDCSDKGTHFWAKLSE